MSEYEKMLPHLRACDRAIAIYYAVSENTALSVAIRNRASADAVRMQAVKRLIYKFLHQPHLFN